MTHQPNTADARIDQVLNALRTTAPPSGLEQRVAQRVAARIAQASETRTTAPSFFAVILTLSLPKGKDPRIFFAEAKLYTIAATALTLLLTITTLTLHHHRTPPTAAQSKPIPNKPYAPTQPATLAQASGPANTQVSRSFSFGNAQVPQGFSLGSHTPSQRAGGLTPAPSQPTDPDTIALAETLAPSHPAPPTPLTQQELLMLAVLRSGNQEGIAALDPAKRDALLAQNELAFNKFFAPPPPTPTPPPTPKTGAKE